MVALPRIRPTIFLFGDSLTQQGWGWVPTRSVGWVSLLASSYTRRADVLNRGFSGYNTRMALDVLPRLFAEKSGDSNTLFCTVYLGANDMAVPGDRQHVPVEEYKEHLKKIVDIVREKTNAPVILMTPPPVDEAAWGEAEKVYNGTDFTEPSRTNELSRLYGMACKEVAGENECHVLDVFALLGGDNKSQQEFAKHLRDGLHLSQSGNILLFEGLMELIEKEYPHLAPATDDTSTTGIPQEEKDWSELC